MSTNASSSSVAASIEPTLTMQFCGAMVALQWLTPEVDHIQRRGSRVRRSSLLLLATLWGVHTALPKLSPTAALVAFSVFSGTDPWQISSIFTFLLGGEALAIVWRSESHVLMFWILFGRLTEVLTVIVLPPIANNTNSDACAIR